MFDRVVRTEQQGFFSRMASSLIGVLIGFALVPASIALMTWNEYRTIHRTQGLLQAEKVVAEVPNPMEVLPELEQRLVHVTGTATTEESLADNVFNLDRAVLRFERQVEMYQWQERKESKTRDKLGGGKETVTTYEYQRQWSRDRIHSESFEQPSGHANPQPRYESTSMVAQKATLGAFRLRVQLVSQLNSWSDVSLNEANLLAKIDAAERSHFKTDGGYLHFSPEAVEPNSPKIGDLRIRFKVVEPMTVSLLAAQRDRDFEPFSTSNGETIESIVSGPKSAAEMFDSLRFANTTLAIVLRAVGWLLACVGFSLMAGPLQAFANIVPLFGKMVGAATMLVGFILGSTVALITISIAWIAVRPLYSISLLALAGVGIYFMFRRKKTVEPPMAVLVE